jgi:hypothetical protein
MRKLYPTSITTPPFQANIPANTTEIATKILAASAAMDANPRLKASVAPRQFDALYHLLLRRRQGVPPVGIPCT